MLLISIALAFGFLVSCASAPRMVPTIRETASQWSADVDKHIPEAHRAGRVKQLGLQGEMMLMISVTPCEMRLFARSS